MKIVKILLVVLIMGGVLAAILFRNKAVMEAKAEQPITTAIKVSVQPVQQQTFTESIEVSGTIQAQSEVPVVSETQGRVLKIYANLGAYLSAGSPIAQVDTVLKYSTFLVAKAGFDKSKKDLERLTQLHNEKSIADTEFENAQLAFQNAKAQFIAAERQLQDALIKAPVGGTLIERPVNAGMMVAPGQPVATLVDISTLKIRANVPEQEVLKLHVGDKITVRVDVYPNTEFEGTITFISAKGNDAHVYPIEVQLPNNSRYPLKAAMSARLVRRKTEERVSLTIPRLALVGSTKTPSVYVLEGTTAKLRTITLGAEKGTNLEVLRGLQSGERVIVVGQQNLRDGVEVAIQ